MLLKIAKLLAILSVLYLLIGAISFSGMKAEERRERANSIYDRILELPKHYVPKTLPNSNRGTGGDVGKPVTEHLCRKRFVGDWKDHFSGDDVARM